MIGVGGSRSSAAIGSSLALSARGAGGQTTHAHVRPPAPSTSQDLEPATPTRCGSRCARTRTRTRAVHRHPRHRARRYIALGSLDALGVAHAVYNHVVDRGLPGLHGHDVRRGRPAGARRRASSSTSARTSSPRTSALALDDSAGGAPTAPASTGSAGAAARFATAGQTVTGLDWAQPGDATGLRAVGTRRDHALLDAAGRRGRRPLPGHRAPATDGTFVPSDQAVGASFTISGPRGRRPHTYAGACVPVLGRPLAAARTPARRRPRPPACRRRPRPPGAARRARRRPPPTAGTAAREEDVHGVREAPRHAARMEGEGERPPGRALAAEARQGPAHRDPCSARRRRRSSAASRRRSAARTPTARSAAGTRTATAWSSSAPTAAGRCRRRRSSCGCASTPSGIRTRDLRLERAAS